MPLTPKQATFVREFAVDLNATQAAVRAGYSPKTAEQQGSRLFRNVQVRAEIDRLQAKVAQKAEVTAEEVLRGLKREANGEGDDTSSSSRVNAWGLLGKHLALFTDKTELSGADGGPLQVTFNINTKGKK